MCMHVRLISICTSNLPYRPLDYVHTVSFSLGFYIVLRPQGIKKQMKTLRKRHRVHIALVCKSFSLQLDCNQNEVERSHMLRFKIQQFFAFFVF